MASTYTPLMDMAAFLKYYSNELDFKNASPTAANDFRYNKPENAVAFVG